MYDAWQMPRRQLTKSGSRHIGAPLRRLLDERFITQEELARSLEVSVGNVSRWVRNETAPQKRRLRQIAEYFGVDPASLIDDLDKAA